MKILLSPAKSIDTSRAINCPTTTVPSFLEETDYLVNKLKKFSAKQFEKLMHVSKEIGELNFERYQSWERPEKMTDNVRPVISSFTGEVYRGLDAASFSDEDFYFAQENLRILSGLYGILKPLDLMYPYRLEMGTKWKVTPVKSNLYKFWGDKLSGFLNEEMKGEEEVINLASTEYFKAIDKKVLRATVITPIFKEFKNGEYKVVMTYAKNARGVMTRFIIKNKISNPEEIKLFNENGYSFDVNQSTDTDWVFTR